MDNIEDLNFNDIQLIADYIEGKITDKSKRDKITHKLETDELFREEYTESYEYLKNIENTSLESVPEDLKNKVKRSVKPKLIFRIMSNIVELVKNELAYISVKESLVEYLSQESDKVVSQNFVLRNTTVEIKYENDGIYKILLNSPIGTKILFERMPENKIIIDFSSKEDNIEINSLERGVYKLEIDGESLTFELT